MPDVQSRGIFSWDLNKLTTDIKRASFLLKVSPSSIYVSYSQLLILFLFIFSLNYMAFILSAIMNIRVLVAIRALVFPLFSLMGGLCLAIFAYASSAAYTKMLSETNSNSLHYMYISILGTIYLPLAIVVSNLFNRFSLLAFGLVGIASEYFTRKAILDGREFEDRITGIHFITGSMAIHLGYVFIAMLLYVH